MSDQLNCCRKFADFCVGGDAQKYAKGSENYDKSLETKRRKNILAGIFVRMAKIYTLKSRRSVRKKFVRVRRKHAA